MHFQPGNTHTNKFTPRSQYGLRHLTGISDLLRCSDLRDHLDIEPLSLFLWLFCGMMQGNLVNTVSSESDKDVLVSWSCFAIKIIYWNEMAFGYIFSGSEKCGWHGFYSRITSSIWHHSNDAIWMKEISVFIWLSKLKKSDGNHA